MSKTQQDPENFNKNKRVITRRDEDVQLIKQLQLSPDAFITDRASDEGLDKISLKIKLIGGNDFIIDEYVAEQMERYATKFFKDWFYKLADIYGVERSVMNVYVKPDFVRCFIIQFVYGRFPYMLLRTLRSRNRKGVKKGKLFQYLRKDVSRHLDKIISEVYEIMSKTDNIKDFKMAYSKEYKLFFQLSLFQ